MKRRLSLRRLLTLRMAIVALTPILVIALIVTLRYLPQNQQIRVDLQQQLADSIALQASLQFEQSQRSLVWLAEQLREEDDPATRQLLLERFVDASGQYAAIYLASPDGTLQQLGLPAARRAEQARQLTQRLPAQRLGDVPRDTPGGRWSEGFISTLSGNLSTAWGIALDDQVLIAEMEINRVLQPLLQRMGSTGRQQLLLLDQHDRLIADSHALPVAALSPLGSLAPLQQLRQGQPAQGQFELAGERFSGLASRLPANDWRILLALPLEDVQQSEREPWVRLFFSTLAALAVTLPVAAWTAHSLTRPVRAILGQTRRIADGRYEEALEESQIHEFAQLNQNLRRMEQSIQQREQALRATAQELHLSETRLLATLERTPNVAVQWYDEAGRVLLWNPASEHLYGIAADQAVGRTLDQLIYTAE